MPNPYFISGPATINFSSGRSSGYMLKMILEAHGGRLPDDVKVVFCNTGKERQQSLDFAQRCSERWKVHINWLEYRYTPGLDGQDGKHGYEVVSHNAASRDGEPFEMVLQARRPFLPNPTTRFCSIELKTRTTYRWVKAELGWDHWTSVLGFRADEHHRVAKAKARNESGRDVFEAYMPMAIAGVSKHDVRAWWAQQDFDLELPNINGNTPHGNCDLCFLKKYSNLMGLIRENPSSADWWIEQERKRTAAAETIKPGNDRFRLDRPSYARMKQLVADQGDIGNIVDDDESISCACTD